MQLVENKLDYTGDWELPTVLLFTGNPFIKTNGAIVMGRGAARVVRDTYPGIDVAFAQAIKLDPDAHIHVLDWYGKPIGWFKVKHHWQLPADLNLIRQSCFELAGLAAANPEVTWHLNFPGIGNGKLSVDAVMPILEEGLPDSVYVYR